MNAAKLDKFSPLVLCLFLLSGCSSMETVKNTLRTVSDTMINIVTLSMQFEGDSVNDHLEDIEERINDACGSLFDSAEYRFRGEDIPLTTQLGVVLEENECQSVVVRSQSELYIIENQGLYFFDTP